MGQEAVCTCDWNCKKTSIKALLEPPELILRGETRRRLPFSKLQDVMADGEMLRFTFEGERIALSLGNTMATKWAQALLKPPPSLAKKLGITSETAIWMMGRSDDPALHAALKEAKSVSPRNGDLIVARIDTPAHLQSVLLRAAERLGAGIPIWFIYRKGPGHPLNENLVRATALATGIVDTKVAAISAELTALRLVKRRG